MAAYFAQRQSVALRITPLPQQLEEPGLPMAFDVAMGVRRDLGGLRMEIEAALDARRPEVDAVLEEFAVPRLDGGGN